MVLTADWPSKVSWRPKGGPVKATDWLRGTLRTRRAGEWSSAEPRQGAIQAGLENLANLGLVPPVGATVIVAPIKLENGSGGPARVLALVK